jgi:homoserine kinase
MEGACVYFIMAILRVYKRNSTFMDLSDLVEEISRLGLVDALQKYHNKPLEKEAKSIVAGPSFLQFLNKLFQIQISAGDVIQFESGNNSKYYMLSVTGTWDEIIRLQ